MGHGLPFVVPAVGQTKFQADLDPFAAITDRGIADRLIQPIGESTRVVQADAWTNHRKLRRAGLRDCIFQPHPLRQHGTKLPDELVADGSTQRCNQVVESIDFHHDDADFAAVALRQRQRLPPLLLEVFRAGEARFRIDHDFLGHGLELAASRRQPDQCIETGEQFRGTDALGDEIRGAAFLGAVARRLVLVAGNHDDRHLADARNIRFAHALAGGHSRRGSGMVRSEISTWMLGSSISVCQPASPSASSRTSKRPLMSLTMVARTMRESSTIRTRGRTRRRRFHSWTGESQPAQSTTTRPCAWPLMNSSNTGGRSASLTVRVMPARCAGRMSPARRSHTLRRSGMAV